MEIICLLLGLYTLFWGPLKIFKKKRTILCLGEILCLTIIYILHKEGFRFFEWNEWGSVGDNIGRFLGSILGMSVVAFPLWLFVIIMTVIHFVSYVKNKVKNKKKIEVFYSTAFEEITKNEIDKTCWGKAFVKAGGNETQARALYVKMRAKTLANKSFNQQGKKEKSEKFHSLLVYFSCLLIPNVAIIFTDPGHIARIPVLFASFILAKIIYWYIDEERDRDLLFLIIGILVVMSAVIILTFA